MKKEEIIDNLKEHKKKVAIVLIILLLICGGSYMAYSAINQPKKEYEQEEINYETSVSGLKDWIVKVGEEKLDYLEGIEWVEDIVKDVKVDDSKVDLFKEGEYELFYSILPIDKDVEVIQIVKKVTVEAIATEEEDQTGEEKSEVVTQESDVQNNEETTEVTKEEVKTDQRESMVETPMEDTGSSSPESNADKPIDKPSPNEPFKPEEEKPHVHNWEEIEHIEKYEIIFSDGIGACNSCGKVLVNGYTGLNIVKEHFQETSKAGKAHGSWHSDFYGEGYCYDCGGHIAYRQCCWGVQAREQCKHSESFEMIEEISENTFMYYDVCDCGANIILSKDDMGAIKSVIVKCADCGEAK